MVVNGLQNGTRRQLLRIGSASLAMASSASYALVGMKDMLFLTGPRSFIPVEAEAKLAKFVKPPPNTDKTEAAELVAMLNLRTPARVQEIKAQAVEPPDTFFWAMLGVDRHTQPALARAAALLLVECGPVIFALKAKFDRTRPTVVRPDLVPVVEVPWHQSYPSGHATQGALMGLLFTLAYPDKAAKCRALGERIGRNREVAGLHYPSDTNAGFSLATHIWDTARPAVLKALG